MVETKVEDTRTRAPRHAHVPPYIGLSIRGAKPWGPLIYVHAMNMYRNKLMMYDMWYVQDYAIYVFYMHT